jgi:hypothetical protein
MCVHRLLPWLMLALAVGGCGRVHAPAGAVPRPEAAQADAFGGWARVTHAAGGVQIVTEGELIAVGPDSVWLLRDSGPLAIPTPAIGRIQVTGFDSAPGTVGAATALGVLATVSNGWLLVLTAPAWLITGAVASETQARQSRVLATPQDIDRITLFARFPQGLPPGFDPATLRPRPRPQ